MFSLAGFLSASIFNLSIGGPITFNSASEMFSLLLYGNLSALISATLLSPALKKAVFEQNLNRTLCLSFLVVLISTFLIPLFFGNMYVNFSEYLLLAPIVFAMTFWTTVPSGLVAGYTVYKILNKKIVNELNTPIEHRELLINKL